MEGMGGMNESLRRSKDIHQLVCMDTGAEAGWPGWASCTVPSSRPETRKRGRLKPAIPWPASRARKRGQVGKKCRLERTLYGLDETCRLSIGSGRVGDRQASDRGTPVLPSTGGRHLQRRAGPCISFYCPPMEGIEGIEGLWRDLLGGGGGKGAPRLAASVRGAKDSLINLGRPPPLCVWFIYHRTWILVSRRPSSHRSRYRSSPSRY